MVESLREREVLYKLIISQLRYDGLDMVAANLAKCVGLETTPLSPSSRLLGLMKLGLQEEKNGIVPDMDTAPGLAPPIPPARGLDLEYEIEGSKEVETSITSHSDTNNKFQQDENGVTERLPKETSGSDAFCGSIHSVAIPTSLDVSLCGHIDDEIDLNAQPTLIACRGDILLEECVSEGDREKDNKMGPTLTLQPAEERVMQNILSTNDLLDTDNDVLSNCGSILSEMVDFDPRNKGKLTDKIRCSSDVICEAFRPFRERFRFVNFKELVSSELLKFGINQSIFAKTVLKRSQGYLSDLLNHQLAIFCMKEPSRMLTNFMKIKKFLDLDDMERRAHYVKCVQKSGAAEEGIEGRCYVKISQRKKRVTFTKDVKDGLMVTFKDRTTMPDATELEQISIRFGLEIPTIKNFFRNLKARSKIS